ncbi:hypothetical protein B0T17DRAFT_513344 [Bombardia bombarda]|uniref:Uncharacterized protein n=1 Tax=Bombardia bombarda TaxID=252184 RepID=A0AA40CD55_9PEZI|nr:hypothetical protein B0T17DRAFT_513344 [Bombardia bombarda]
MAACFVLPCESLHHPKVVCCCSNMYPYAVHFSVTCVCVRAVLQNGNPGILMWLAETPRDERGRCWREQACRAGTRSAGLEKREWRHESSLAGGLSWIGSCNSWKLLEMTGYARLVPDVLRVCHACARRR